MLPPSSLAELHEITPAYLPAGVSVWLLELVFERTGLARLLNLLSGEERQRCLRYRQLADQVRFAATRVTLKQLLAERLQLPFEEISFDIGPFGKPRLAQHARPFFNVSHSGNFSLIALSTHRPVGVDIEAVPMIAKPEFGYAGLTQEECKYCDEHQDTSAYLQIWSGKEAALKALGVGITGDLLSLSVLPVTAEQYAVSPMHGATAELDVWQLSVRPFFVAALALTSCIWALE